MPAPIHTVRWMSAALQFYITLEDLFFYDPNSPQNHEEDDTEQFALITEIKVDDRTNNKALFDLAIVKGEDGQGILTTLLQPQL